jgi:large subunit ribosomal protein L46
MIKIRNLATTTKPHISVGILLKRNPLILPQLSPFEHSYALYKDEQIRNLSRKLESGFFFKKGSLAEQKYLKYSESRHEKGENVVFHSEEIAQLERKMTFEKDGDLKSLQRFVDKALYLLIKGEDGKWKFPETDISNEEEGLEQVAKSKLEKEFGESIISWVVGRIPIGVLSIDQVSNFYLEYIYI